MKIAQLFLMVLFFVPYVTYAKSIVVPTYVNDSKQICYIGTTEWRRCEKATLGEGWVILPSFDMKCPDNYRKVDSVDWVWSEIESFDTLSDAMRCGKTFSKGSPIWTPTVGITLGIVLAGVLLIHIARKRKK